MSNSIKLNFSKTDEPLEGRSKWWGAPDLPKGHGYPIVHCKDEDDEWDEPLTFLCQIRCEDIAALDEENLLPHEGMLYFFAAIDDYLGLDCPIETHIGEWDPEAVRVVYSPTCEGLEPYEMTWGESGESVFYPAEKLTFEPCGMLEDGFKLLGRPYLCEINEEYDTDYVSLLQIDGNDDWGLRFYDCGMLCLLIRKSQLRARFWETVVGYMHSF